MKEIKVSVIVPAYNVEEYLEACLSSLVLQTLEDIEILVVNDGSTDSTQEIADSFAARFPGKVVVLSQENGGPAKARNRALECAKGEYIGFVDADDRPAYDMFERMYEEATAKNADLVVCGRAYTDYSGNVTSTWLPAKINGTSNIFQNHKLLPDTSSFVWDKLFRRTLIEQYGFKFNEDIHYAEDALFVYKFLYYATTVCSIQDALYYYTVQRAGSITGAMDERMLHEIAACKALTEFYIQVGAFSIFQDDLLWIAIGFWGRKFYSFCNKKTDKKLNYTFVCEFYDFLEKYYPKWKEFLRKYSTRGNKWKYKINAYKANKRLVKLYIYMPSTIIKMVRGLRTFKAKIGRFGIKKAIKKVCPDCPLYEPYLTVHFNKPIINNRILLIPNSGDNLAGNVFYLMRDIAKRNTHEIFIGSKNPSKMQLILENNGIFATVVKMDSNRFQEVLATAKYLVTNYRFPTYFCKKQGQVVLNTWHGTPLKYLGRHMNNGLRDLGNVQSQFLACDYLLYPNEYTRERMMDAFMLNDFYKNQVLVEGYPRNDVFYEKEQPNKLRKILGLVGKKVFVYMPTWRGQSVSMTTQEYFGELKTMLDTIDAALDDDIVLFVKLHNLAKKQFETGYKHIRPFPENLEIYQLLNAADALITDYSSVFYDFANTGKEIILFSYDEELYEKERGMYCSLSEFPFIRIHETDALTEYLNNWNGFVKTEEYDQFWRTYCYKDTLGTSARVTNILFSEKSSQERYNSEKYTICFATDLYHPSMMQKALELISAEEKLVFVFDMKSISPKMTNLLRSPMFAAIKYIVVQNEHIFSAQEKSDVMSGKETCSVHSALEREALRMLPNIKIGKAINLTNDPVFERMTMFFNRPKG